MSLKADILQAGLKQKKVAEKIGITPEHLNLMLNGKATMSEEVRIKIKDLLSKVAI